MDWSLNLKKEIGIKTRIITQAKQPSKGGGRTPSSGSLRSAGGKNHKHTFEKIMSTRRIFGNKESKDYEL
jgi:hypothetical protein